MKRIFDIIKDKEIIILYQDEEIHGLCELLKTNKITCNEDIFVGYSWVKINTRDCISFANFGPINHNCNSITYKQFIQIIS